MAKQIITMELEFRMKEKAPNGGYPFKAWLANHIIGSISWITGCTILSVSPVHWDVDEDPDDPEFRKKFVDHTQASWNL